MMRFARTLVLLHLALLGSMYAAVPTGEVDPVQIDSIVSELKMHFGTARRFAQQENNPRKALNYLQIVSESDDYMSSSAPAIQEQYAWLLWLQGKCYSLLGDLESSGRLYQESADLLIEAGIQTPKVARFILQPLGNLFTRTGDYEKAETILQLAIKIALDAGNTSYECGIKSDLGIIYLERGEWIKAVAHYEDLLSSCDDHLQKVGLAMVNLGIALKGIGNPQPNPESSRTVIMEGIRQLNSISTVRDKNNLTSQLGEAHRELAHAFERLQQPDSARFHYLKSLALLEERWPDRNRREFAKSLVPLAALEREAGHLSLAMEHVQQALQSVLPDWEPESTVTLAALFMPAA